MPTIKRMNPLGRLGEVEDIARVVSLLLDPDAFTDVTRWSAAPVSDDVCPRLMQRN